MMTFLATILALTAAASEPSPAPEDARTDTVSHTYTCLGRQADLDIACRRLRWEPGAPTPDGYTLRNQPRVAPLAVGGAMLGGAYLARLATTEYLIGLGDLRDAWGHPRDRSHYRWHYVPVVGPWAVLAADAQHGTLTSTDIALNITDGVLQGVGAALIIWGATDRERVWVKGKPQLRSASVAPKRGGIQITLDGRF